MIVFLSSIGAINLQKLLQFYQEKTYCPYRENKARNCFRLIITSGDKEERLFSSTSNYFLEEGTKYFKKFTQTNNPEQKEQNYNQAVLSFQQAIESDPADPVPQIYLNNAKARWRGNPLKLAVVVPIDSYEEAAKNILQGVADAQDEFNNERRKNQNHSLLEIVIANDSNEGLLAKNVAKKLADDISILGIIGHHVSESSQVALDIYKKVNLPVVSSTSSSSKLKSDNFFRTVSSTQKASDLYFKYVTQVLKLKLKDVAIFYTQGSAYSKSIGDTFIKAFNEDPQKVKTFTLGSIYESESLLNIKNTIEEIIGKKYKAVLLLSSAKTNSGTIAFAKENNKLPTARLQLLGSMALAEAATLRKGGKDIEGMILASPCVNQESAYMKEAAKRWQEEVYWRVATSYDAAQALIEAIRLSKEPTRQEIFNKLQNLTLPPAKTSGLGLQWSKEDLNYNTNSQRPYCLFKIENNKFIEIPSE